MLVAEELDAAARDDRDPAGRGLDPVTGDQGEGAGRLPGRFDIGRCRGRGRGRGRGCGGGIGRAGPDQQPGDGDEGKRAVRGGTASSHACSFAWRQGVPPVGSQRPATRRVRVGSGRRFSH
ncbi:hypothetical protein E1211_21145 [Micromonospora sp. 15K316]|nr:hypothetical protein E1211_21145 [Micromonospora sp. 15K316]